jgi:EpsI family protein
MMGRRKFLIGGAFGLAAALAAWRQPGEHLNVLGSRKLEDIVPKKIGSWEFLTASGLVVPPEDDLVDDTYSQLLTRVYTQAQAPSMMLLIAHSATQTGILQVHRPEACYTASGYKLLDIIRLAIPLGSTEIPGNLLTAQGGGVTEYVYYWTRVGDALPLSWGAQRRAVAEQNLRGIIPDATLVRVSTLARSREEAALAITQFVRTLISSVAPADRKSLIA